MSLTARIIVLTVAATAGVVIALFAVQLNNVVESWLSTSLVIAETAGQQIKNLVLLRLEERTPRTSARPDDRKQAWISVLRDDRNLASLLESAMAQTRSIIEISIAAENDLIIASSNPMRPRNQMVHRPPLRALFAASALQRVTQILKRGQDFEVTIPLGIQGEDRPVLTIQLLVSSVLLREDLLPAMQRVAAWGLAAVLVSVVLAYTSARLAVSNLRRLAVAIDRISSGEADPQSDDRSGATREFAVIESKLSLLGHQFRGAIEGASELRSTVRKLLDHLEEAILLFDANERLVLAGGAAARILGIPAEVVSGRPLSEVFPPDTPLGGLARRAYQVRQGVNEQPIDWRHNGTTNRLLVTIELIPDSGHSAGFTALVRIRDAAGPQQLESQLELSARLDAMHRLIGSVAHEVKNPLNSIAVRLDYVQSWVATDFPEAVEEIQVIVQEVNRLDRVVRNFLDFTRPVELAKEELDMIVLVREITELVKPDAERRGVSVSFKSTKPAIPVCGDPDLLKEAILNVVANGIESMPKGGSLVVEVSEAFGVCQITIKDTGSGIPAAVRERIFELYFTTKERGSGLGLPMTYRAIQLHGGSIDLTSEPGAGTSFCLRIPVSKAGSLM